MIYGISTIVGYLIPNPSYTSKQFYFKQFSLAYVAFWGGGYKELKVKTVLFQIIQFSICTEVISIKHFYFKQFRFV